MPEDDDLPEEVHQPEWIGARVIDHRGIAYTRFSDSEAHNEGDWINEDGVIVQWSYIAAPRRFPPGGADA